MLRLITDGKISPEEAVRAYHGVLQGKNIKPKLPLEKDLELTEQAMSYEGTGRTRTTIALRNNPLSVSATSDPKGGADQQQAEKSTNPAWPTLPNGKPNFDAMNSVQRRAYDNHRLSRKFGRHGLGRSRHNTVHLTIRIRAETSIRRVRCRFRGRKL